ncbi:imidazole glycerol phosphate synthase subunit HisH [Pseudomonas sp. o96-267]|uniref:imidazole glycerol phosphate synthase subunit HisH n=1 Tax=Pseudomonas sp. o96-267 TaxID=2479853 RepID=UPI000F78B9E7|nr:imidazole glycerol phosphate synthase subunit HisH [Pseudomonas sp. o96-267]RRV29808.1 imidazole glycerol phosphate synthase subunit HisH [Pseudomonas sp. o96-267]
MISIVDCGMGNIGSIANLLKHIGVPNEVVSEPKQVAVAHKIILPGVGHWNNGMETINSSGLRDELNEAALVRKIPILGICLGMQLLLESSEEGEAAGLGWIEGKVRRFDFSSHGVVEKLKVPHMGWNAVVPNRLNPLSSDLADDVRFYFVHSFHAVDVRPADVFMTCSYGYEFSCAINHGNIWGVQFHPEKSHKHGMQLLRNFASLEIC